MHPEREKKSLDERIDEHNRTRITQNGEGEEVAAVRPTEEHPPDKQQAGSKPDENSRVENKVSAPMDGE